MQHQSQFLQAPYLLSNCRYFMFVGGYCVAAGTEIDTPAGPQKIEKIRGNTAVLSVYKQKVRKEQAVPFLPQGRAPMVTLSFSNGKSLTCSLNHRLMLESGRFVRVSALLHRVRKNMWRTMCTCPVLLKKQWFTNRVADCPTGCGSLCALSCYETILWEEDNKKPALSLLNPYGEAVHITKITFVGTRVKYDLSVSGNHNYIASGVVNHNSCGKTSCLASCIEFLIVALQGKSDYENRNPRVIVGGLSLGHLLKTTINYLLQDLEKARIPYHFNKKDNIFTVGNVEIMMVSLSEPDRIMGLDVTCFAPWTEILCRKKHFNKKGLTKPQYKRIMDIAKDFSAWEVLTPLGWRNLVFCGPTGWKEVVDLEGVPLTADHKVLDAQNGFKEASSFAEGDAVWRTDLQWARKERSCRKMLQRLSIAATCIIDIEKTRCGKATTISSAAVLILLLRCIGLFIQLALGKVFQPGGMYTIKTATRLITDLVILSACPTASILKSIVCSVSSACAVSVERHLNTLIKKLSSAPSNAGPLGTIKTEQLDSIQKQMERLTADLRQYADAAEKSSGQTSRMPCTVLKSAATGMLTLADLLLLNSIGNSASVKSAAQSLRQPRNLLQLLARLRARTKSEPRRYTVYDLTVAGQEAPQKSAEAVRLEHSVFCRQGKTGTSLCSSNCALLDEVDELVTLSGGEMAFEATKAVNERLRQGIRGFRSPFMMIATTAQGQRGMYRIYNQFKKANTTFFLLRGRSRDNTYIAKKDPQYLPSMMKLLSPAEQRVLLDGHFEALGSGKVFPDFDWDRNYADIDMDLEVTADDVCYASMDFNTNYNRATVFIVRGGIVYAVKSYDFPNPRDAPRVWRNDFPHSKIYFIPDNTSNKEVMTYYRELRNHDVRWIAKSRNPNVEDSVFAANKLLFTGRLVFTRAAKDTAEAVAMFMRDKNQQVPPGRGPRDAAHFSDSVRYTCFYLVTTNAAFLDILRISLQRRITAEQDAEAEVEELPGGYIKIKA